MYNQTSLMVECLLQRKWDCFLFLLLLLKKYNFEREILKKKKTAHAKKFLGKKCFCALF